MRLGILTTWIAGGGAERQVAQWAQMCAQAGHEVTVFSLYRTGTDFDIPGTRVIHLPKSRAHDLPKIAWQVRQASRSLDAMVAFEPYAGLCCTLARPEIPWMLTTGKDPRRWRDTSRIPTWVFRRIFRAPAVLTAPTQGMIDCHKAMGLRPEGPWLLVPNVVDTSAFTASETNGTARQGALFVGRFVPLKNPLKAVEAAEAAGVPLKLLGEGELQATLEAVTADPERGAGITVLNWDFEPWATYAEARALVVTSDYESFGNVIVESLAAGTPVVSVDCDFGPREILEGSRYSRLVDTSVDSIARGLSAVMEQPYSREEWQECTTIAHRYHPDAIWPTIERGLQQLIDSRERRAEVQ